MEFVNEPYTDSHASIWHQQWSYTISYVYFVKIAYALHNSDLKPNIYWVALQRPTYQEYFIDAAMKQRMLNVDWWHMSDIDFLCKSLLDDADEYGR